MLKGLAMDFVCPICRGALTVGENLTKRCAMGHSYDRSRAGYYNLLVGVGAGNHGDNREMLEARRAFLGAGYYAPLAERIADTVLSLTPRGGTVLDNGAGEGYYTDKIECALHERDGASSVLAFDISKDAAKYIARANSRLSVAVASSYSMPVADGSIDTAVTVFSPLAREELLRVLRRGGKLVLVFPDELHLFGLKSAIYDNPYKNKPQSTELDGFKLLSDEALDYEVELKTNEDVRSLFMMTPYAYRTPRESRERVLSMESLTTSVNFRIVSYEKI